jgi:hypothetical protein
MITDRCFKRTHLCKRTGEVQVWWLIATGEAKIGEPWFEASWSKKLERPHLNQ